MCGRRFAACSLPAVSSPRTFAASPEAITARRFGKVVERSVVSVERGCWWQVLRVRLTVQDNTQLFKLFADNPDFRRWLTDTAFRLAYEAAG